MSVFNKDICLSFIMRIGIGCNCICSVCVQLRVRVFYYLLIDFWRKLTSTVMVWVRCYESIYYSLKWKFKKSNSITNDKYLANSEMIWAFVQFQTNEFRLKKMSLIYENSSSFDMKKKLECDIHKQKLIIVDLSVKLLQWHLDVNHTELKYKTFWLKPIVSYKVILYFFSSTFDYQISYLNHFCKCICTRKSHQNLHALLYGATIGWFFNSRTDWTDFLYNSVLMCVFCGGFLVQFLCFS